MEIFEPKNRRTKVAADIGHDLTAVGPWSDLPQELLSLIANRLGLIALLAFRGTCKTWRSASSEASALCECEPDKDPSFIVCNDQARTCSFYYRTSIYNTMNLPELENANCLASDQGWLLLHSQGSLFFFCPFSRERIDLPVCPESDLSGHVAAFSAPPTSTECIVALINSRQVGSMVKLYIIRRGETQWTHQESRYGWFMRGLNAIVYVEIEKKGSFYLMAESRLLRFSVVENNWIPYNIVDSGTRKDVETLPFSYCKNFFSKCAIKELIGLEDDASISICGTALPGEDCVHCVCNEKVEARSGNAVSNLKGIWIQPRFIQIPENQGWNL